MELQARTAAVFLSAVAVVTAAMDGGRIVLYPKSKPGGLVCYKDSRMDGGAFWTYSSQLQRRPHIFHCPSSLSAWCVNVATGQLSERGCSGPSGINRAGCFQTTNAARNVTSNVCLCKRNYCNAAARTSPPVSLALLAAAVSVGMIYCVPTAADSAQ